MPKIKIDSKRCKGCYLCIANCPNALIRVSAKMNIKGVKPVLFSGGKPARTTFRSGGCTGCAMCAVICPECGIEVYK